MSQAAPQAPQAPVAPIPSGGSSTPVAATPEPGVQYTVPTNRAELRALERARSDLSTQLTSAANRRERLANDLAAADPGARPGLQARIDQLDQRILRIEQDIALTGDLLARSRLQVTDAGRDGGPPFSGTNMNFTPIAILFTLFVLGPIAISIARAIWRRGSVQRAETQIERENAERLSRLEQAVDTIAVEVERISEGQRFVTKLLADSASREKAMLERGNG